MNKETTQSPEFKKLIKVLNLFTHTEYEKLQANKEDFKKLMPVLRGLTAEEQETLIHKLRNSGRVLGDNATADLLDDMTFQRVE